jgi:uncharacterized secreted protein with C-terminal beta-propeller domain
MTISRALFRASARRLLPSLLALSAACSNSTAVHQGPGEDDLDGDLADEFVSDFAGGSGRGSDDGAGAGTGSNGEGNPAAPPDDDNAGEDPGRVIAEADILQIQGDTLYALSRYAGLTIIDVSNPDKLRTLGNHRVNATPFEMYLEDGIAYVMFNDFGSYVRDEASDSWAWQTASRVQALNVKNPARIRVIGDQEIAGSISDSRLVGDVVYLVTYENGGCWQCEQEPNTRVVSFDISDPSEFVRVDELRFPSEDESWGARSISVTEQRMYVAGPNWQDRDSTIQVVDIADPNGSLRLGAEVPIVGSVQSRWQMDEYEGVLRVITQPAAWRSNDPPRVQTFQVTSSDEVTKLASLSVKLPRPESLQSVRFDGDRAYAITFEQIDPLFTFDLTDPASPKQVGELEIPGFVYHMEPRGDRLYALGFDNQEKAGALHVSIFDVSALDKPVMVDRVNFGGDWASLAEDQDRIHKAFNILLDEGLILVPFSGGSWEQETCHYDYQSGIQLIDTAGDDLTLRGVAPQIGDARRALLHRERLIGITDKSVQVFDISDRDAPKTKDSLEVARNISQLHVMGDKLMRFGTDWWTERATIDFTSLDAASTAEPMGTLDLSKWLSTPTDECNGYTHWEGQAFVHGDIAYVPQRSYSYENTGGGFRNRQRLTFFVVDLSDAEKPALIGTFKVENTSADGYLGGVVLTESALLVGRGEGNYNYDPLTGERYEPSYSYDIFDLKDPRKPRLATRFEVPNELAFGGWGYGAGGCMMDMGWGWWSPGYGSSGALVSGDLVVSQHEESIKGDASRVRYYLDRLDVSDPEAPKLLAPINIPGQVVHYDGEKQRIVTLDYRHRTARAKDYRQCSGLGQGWFDEQKGACHVYDRRAHVLELDGNRAVRTSMVYLDSNDRVSTSVAVSDERLFFATRERTKDGYADHVVSRVDALSYDDDGRFERLPPSELSDSTQPWSQMYARGARAFVVSSGSMQVVDTRDEDKPVVKALDMLGWGCQSLEVQKDTAYCALGEYGVFSFDLK